MSFGAKIGCQACQRTSNVYIYALLLRMLAFFLLTYISQVSMKASCKADQLSWPAFSLSLPSVSVCFWGSVCVCLNRWRAPSLQAAKVWMWSVITLHKPDTLIDGQQWLEADVCSFNPLTFAGRYLRSTSVTFRLGQNDPVFRKRNNKVFLQRAHPPPPTPVPPQRRRHVIFFLLFSHIVWV